MTALFPIESLEKTLGGRRAARVTIDGHGALILTLPKGIRGAKPGAMLRVRVESQTVLTGYNMLTGQEVERTVLNKPSFHVEGIER